MNSSSKYVLAVVTVTLAVSCGVFFKMLELTATKDQSNTIDDQRYGIVLNQLEELTNETTVLNYSLRDLVEQAEVINANRFRLSSFGRSHIEADIGQRAITINTICKEQDGSGQFNSFSIIVSCFDRLVDKAGGKIFEGSVESTVSARSINLRINNVSYETIAINEIGVSYSRLTGEDEPGAWLVSGVGYSCNLTKIAPNETRTLKCINTEKQSETSLGTSWTWDVDSVSVYVD